MARPARPVTRKQIVEGLVSLSTELGRSPCKVEYHGRTGVTHRQFETHFETWNDAIVAADLRPNRVAGTSGYELLDDWGSVARELGRCPQLLEYCTRGKYGRHAFLGRFKSWTGVARAFYARSVDDPQWRDVVTIIRERESRGVRPWFIAPDFASKVATSCATGVSCGITYGEPMDFECFRNAPVNEVGVVFLFGCLAHKLGYIVEAIQPSFPDCEAKHKDACGILRRVRIEFEFESKNFLLHKHDVGACDIIVCWRDNWEECPLEVVDLSKEVAALKKAAA